MEKTFDISHVSLTLQIDNENDKTIKVFINNNPTCLNVPCSHFGCDNFNDIGKYDAWKWWIDVNGEKIMESMDLQSRLASMGIDDLESLLSALPLIMDYEELSIKDIYNEVEDYYRENCN